MVTNRIVYFIVPYLAFLSPNTMYAGLYGALAIRNVLSIIAYPVLLIMIKEASPGPSYLGKINGLAAAVGAASRTLASPVSGYLYGVGMRIDFIPLAWWASALVAVCGALQIIFIRQRKEGIRAKDATRFVSETHYKAGHESEVIRIVVESRDDEYSSSDEEA